MSFELKVELKYLLKIEALLRGSWMTTWDASVVSLIRSFLINTHLNFEACKILAQTLVELHSLESLSLSQNPHIGGKGVIVRLIQSLLDKKFLQTLVLRDTGLCNSQETDSTKDICAVA